MPCFSLRLTVCQAPFWITRLGTATVQSYVRASSTAGSRSGRRVPGSAPAGYARDDHGCDGESSPHGDTGDATIGTLKEYDLLDFEKSDLERAREAQTRKCLVCRSPFLSAWAGERICVRCKTTSTWRGGGLKQTTPAKSSTRSKRLE